MTAAPAPSSLPMAGACRPACGRRCWPELRRRTMLDLPAGMALVPAGDTLMPGPTPSSPAARRAVLVGWSLGAQLALHLAAHAPHKVARLVLIGAALRAGAGLAARCPPATLAGFPADFDPTPTPPNAASCRLW